MTDSAMENRAASAAPESKGAAVTKKLNPSAKSFVFNTAAPAWTPPTSFSPAPVVAPVIPAPVPAPAPVVAPPVVAPPAPTSPVKTSVLKPSVREFVPSVYAAPFVPSFAPAPPLPPTPTPPTPTTPVKPADEEKETVTTDSSSSSSSSAAAEAEVDATSETPAAVEEQVVVEEEVEVPSAQEEEPSSTQEETADVDSAETEAQTQAVGQRIMYTIAQLLTMEPEHTPMPASVVGTQVASDKSQDVDDAAAAGAFSGKAGRGKDGSGRSLHRANSSYEKGGRGGRGGRSGRSGRGPPQPEPPLEDVAPLQINEETRWKPSHAKARAEDTSTSSTVEDVSAVALKEAKAILNKLSIEKFDKLSDQLIAVAVTSLDVLTGVIDLVIAKAQHEWHFSTMYASLCSKIAQTEMPAMALDEHEVAQDTHKLFRKLLLTKCQRGFEVTPSREGFDALPDDERAEKELLLKRSVLGHIRFVGELFKQRMLSSRIMHACVQRLFGDVTQPDEESLECLCKLLSTIGHKLESEAKDQAKLTLVLQYYAVIKQLAGDADKLSTRVRFMLQDLLDLRSNKWVARRKETKAMTIAEVHAEVAREAKEKAKASAAATYSGGGSSRGFHRSNSMNGAPSPDKRRKDERGGGGGGGGGASSAWKARAASASAVDADGWETVNPGARPKLLKSRSTVTSGDRAPRHPTLSRNSSDSAPLSRNSFSSLSSIGSGSGRRESRERSLSSSTTPSSNSRRGGGNDTRPPRPSGPASSSSASSPKKTTEEEEEEEEKPPTSAKTAPLSVDAFKLKIKSIVDEFVELQDVAEAVACVTELDSREHDASLVQQAMDIGLDKSAKHRQAVGTLLAAFHGKQLLDKEAFHTSVHEHLEGAEDMEIDIPLTLPYLAQMLAPSVASGALELPRLAQSVQHLAETGKAAKFIVLVLAELKEDADTTTALAKLVDVQALLREGERSEEGLRALYASYQLEFVLQDA